MGGGGGGRLGINYYYFSTIPGFTIKHENITYNIYTSYSSYDNAQIKYSPSSAVDMKFVGEKGPVPMLLLAAT